MDRMDLHIGPSVSPPSRIRAKRWSANIVSLMTSSRAFSSGIFILLIVVTDHLCVAADGYMNRNLVNDYDPMVIACTENFVMIAAVLLAYTILVRRKMIDHNDWIRRVNWKELPLLGFMLGVTGVLWALSSRAVSAQYYDTMTVLTVPIIFFVRYTFFDSFHVFHLSGALYACLGLLCTAFSTAELSKPTKHDYYFLGEVLVWAFLLLSIADFFARNKLMPILGVAGVMLVVRLLCVTVAMIVLLGAGKIEWNAFGCLLVGHDCDKAVPATLLAHALVEVVKFVSYVVVVKYVGAPIAVVTTVASTSLRFYFHTSVTTLQLGAAALGFLGCATFTHGQWMLEVSHNEEWDEQLRRSAASTSMLGSSSEDGDDENRAGEEPPLVMSDG